MKTPEKPSQKVLGKRPYILHRLFQYIISLSLSTGIYLSCLFPRYPEQFWAEIIAYKIGILIGIEVPPAFVAVNKRENKTGAVIEWFLNYPGRDIEVKSSGSWYMQQIIKGYDLAKGTQHNFYAVKKLFEALRMGRYKWNINWIEYWVKTLAFDSLIGNTDRHQDNWGIIWKYKDKKLSPLRMTPVFDNGTSMGHEILENNFVDFENEEKISKYVAKGYHHMKWKIDGSKRFSQVEFLRELLSEYPEMKNVVIGLMGFDVNKLEHDIMELTEFKVPCPLSDKRAKFIVKLLLFRRKNILLKLDNEHELY